MAWLAEMGFDVVEHCMVTAETVAAAGREIPGDKIEQNDIASDGLVLTFDSIAYSQSLGRTAKFPKDSLPSNGRTKWRKPLCGRLNGTPLVRG